MQILCWKLVSWMLSFINIESAGWADMVLIEPWFDALNMKMMFASKEENLVAFFVDDQANCTHSFWIFLLNSLDWNLLQNFNWNSIVLLEFFSHVLILINMSEKWLFAYIEIFKSLNIHAFNRRLRVVGILMPIVLKDTLPFIIPINKIQVVLSSRVDPDRIRFL